MQISWGEAPGQEEYYQQLDEVGRCEKQDVFERNLEAAGGTLLDPHVG